MPKIKNIPNNKKNASRKEVAVSLSENVQPQCKLDQKENIKDHLKIPTFLLALLSFLVSIGFLDWMKPISVYQKDTIALTLEPAVDLALDSNSKALQAALTKDWKGTASKVYITPVVPITFLNRNSLLSGIIDELKFRVSYKRQNSKELIEYVDGDWVETDRQTLKFIETAHPLKISARDTASPVIAGYAEPYKDMTLEELYDGLLNKTDPITGIEVETTVKMGNQEKSMNCLFDIPLKDNPHTPENERKRRERFIERLKKGHTILYLRCANGSSMNTKLSLLPFQS